MGRQFVQKLMLVLTFFYSLFSYDESDGDRDDIDIVLRGHRSHVRISLYSPNTTKYRKDERKKVSL